MTPVKKIDIELTDITARKNIVLFIKEAINNATKYSFASQLNIVVQIIEYDIVIEILDNGIGFDTAITKGNGLGNMQKRIEELKGQFYLTSALNKGTTIRAIIPFVP